MGSTGAPPRKVRRCLKARPTTGPTIERHGHVTGGPDVAILYCLSLMLERGYDYVGLIENDLEPGWFDRIFQLFATPRLNVGSVSGALRRRPCSLASERLCHHGERRGRDGAVQAGRSRGVLDHPRSPSFREYVFLPRHLMDLPCPTPHEAPDANAHWSRWRAHRPWQGRWTPISRYSSANARRQLRRSRQKWRTNRRYQSGVRLRKGGMVPAGAPDCEGISQRVRGRMVAGLGAP